MFNPDEFLNATFDQVIDTARLPVPSGEYVAQVNTDDKAVSVDQGTIGKGERAGQPWASLVVNMTIPDPSGAIKSQTGRDPVIVRHSVFLDLGPDGKMDFSAGKNIGFAKLFAAAGWPTDAKGKLTSGYSFSFLRGKTLKVRIENEPNPKDPSQMFERITAVTKA